MLVKSIYTFSLYSLRFLLFIGFIMCFFNINFNCFELMLNTEIYYDLSILNNYIYKYLLSISLNSIVINCFFIEIFLFFCGLSYIKLVIRALKHFEHEIIICQRLIMKIKLHLFLVGFFFFNPVLYQTLGTFGNNFFVIYNFIVIMKFISYFFYLLIFFFLVKYCQKNNFSFKIEFFFLYYFILYFTFIIYHIKNFLLLLICLETIFFCLIFIFTGLFLKHKSGTFTGVSINSATYASAMQLFFYKTHNYFSIYGTLMYFIYNAFALAFYLFSLLWFFIMSNNLGFFDFFANFRAIFLNVETSMLLSNTFIAQLNINVILFICFIFFCFFLFKLGIFPFHFWVVKILTSLNYISLMILFVPYKLIIYFFFFNNFL